MIIRTASGSLHNICLSRYNSNYELYSLILSTRHYSIANKRKPLILKEGNWIIVLDDDKQYKKIHIPQNIDCEMPKKLGFTDSGIIRFSGSLKCKSNKKQFRISLGIGSSIVSIHES
mgnify:CR=1 FL=1